jgi:isocitrate dehydrogenase
MQVLRGRSNGQTIELLDDGSVAAETHVLVLVLSGELERAAARVARQGIEGQHEPEPDADERHISSRPHTVGEIMTTRLVSVNPRMSVTKAMHLMAQEGITSVLVEPGTLGGWGIMTMRDVLDRIVRTNRAADVVAVGELASRPLLTVPPDLTLQACSELLLERGIRRVVVAEGVQPRGIVSETDIFRVVERHGWGVEG